MKHILLAVTGGIAAYKAIDLTSKLIQSGYDVRVMLSDHAQEFVTPLIKVTIAPLSRNASAIAYPIFPDERFDTYRTGSITSTVGPAVTNACFPEKELFTTFSC